MHPLFGSAIGNIQAHVGDWDWQQRRYAPHRCAVQWLSAQQERNCMRNRVVTFIGDSVMRDFVMGKAVWQVWLWPRPRSAASDSPTGNRTCGKACTLRVVA